MVTSKIKIFDSAQKFQRISDIENIQNLSFPAQEIPRELKKEVLILRKIGLEEYEISYLIYLKTKKEARLKWQKQQEKL